MYFVETLEGDVLVVVRENIDDPCAVVVFIEVEDESGIGVSFFNLNNQPPHKPLKPLLLDVTAGGVV